MRKFAVVRGYEDRKITLPERSTSGSAGYDIESSNKVVIPSIWKLVLSVAKDSLFSHQGDINNFIKPTLVPTGVKAYMGDGEVLKIYVRSSSAVKKFLHMPNSVGIIDKDYADNPDNDGHIMVPLWNFGFKYYVIEKGERIAQGVFTQFLLTENDKINQNERVGGFGSTK